MPAAPEDLYPQPKGGVPKLLGQKATWNGATGLWEVDLDGDLHTKSVSAKGWTPPSQQHKPTPAVHEVSAVQEVSTVQESDEEKLLQDVRAKLAGPPKVSQSIAASGMGVNPAELSQWLNGKATAGVAKKVGTAATTWLESCEMPSPTQPEQQGIHSGAPLTAQGKVPRFLHDTIDDGFLGPITGVMDAPLLPFVQAAAKTRVKDIDPHAFMAEQKAKQMEKDGILCGLTKDEAAAITLYTMEALYKPLNTLLRDRDRNKLKPFFPYLRLLLEAKGKLPKYVGAVWRGVKGKDLSSSCPKDKEVWWWAFNSTTKDLETLQNPAFLGKSGKRTQFMIEMLSGIDISAFSVYEEEEVLLFPGTKLRVKSSAVMAPGLTQIHMEEVAVPMQLMK